MSTTTKSPRRVCMDTLRDLAQKVRNGRYFVKRGPINWATFPFDQKDRAIAIMIDRAEFMRSGAIGNTAEITLEIFGRMPEVPEEGVLEQSIDDGTLDEFVDDAGEILKGLGAALDSDEHPVDFRRSYQTVEFLEAHDADLGVQGIVVTFTVTY